MSGELIKGQFQYAYASDDGQFVAILTHDMTTYVVDLSARRYFAECGGSPRGFAGHVLEMEGSAARRHPWPAANDLFDLDMDADELAWRNCRAALARREDQWRAAPPDRVARSGSICLNRRLAPVFRAALASRCVGHRYNQRMNPSAEFPAPEGATLVDCTLERHADQILAIFNDAIATSTALYDYKPRPRESMDTWFQTKQKGGFPVIGFENAAGELMGFASYGTFRAWPAYKYSVEHSVYVDGRHRGLGLGEALMRALIARARARRACAGRRHRRGQPGQHPPARKAGLQARGHAARGGLQVRPLAGSGVLSVDAGYAREPGRRLTGRTRPDAARADYFDRTRMACSRPATVTGYMRSCMMSRSSAMDWRYCQDAVGSGLSQTDLGQASSSRRSHSAPGSAL